MTSSTTDSTGYRAAEGINYSTLKAIAEHRAKSLVEKVDISDYPSVKQGDLFDMSFQDLELFADKYVYFEGEVPTAKSLKLAEAVIEYCSKQDTKPTKEIAIAIIEANPDVYWKSYKMETKLKQFDNDVFWNYVNFKVQNWGKLLISPQVYENVLTAKNTILTHDVTKKYFDTETIYQLAIYFDLTYEIGGEQKTVKAKILVDVITINHETKRIFPFDFKFISGASAYKIQEYFFSKFYYIQTSLYSYGLKKWAEENYPDYNIYHYQLLAISDKNPTYPVIADPIDYIVSGFSGFKNGFRDYPGITQLVEDYLWHKEKDLWDHSRDYYENNGKIKL